MSRDFQRSASLSTRRSIKHDEFEQLLGDRVDREARFEVHARGAENRWKLIKLLTK